MALSESTYSQLVQTAVSRRAGVSRAAAQELATPEAIAVCFRADPKTPVRVCAKGILDVYMANQAKASRGKHPSAAHSCANCGKLMKRGVAVMLDGAVQRVGSECARHFKRATKRDVVTEITFRSANPAAYPVRPPYVKLDDPKFKPGDPQLLATGIKYDAESGSWVVVGVVSKGGLGWEHIPLASFPSAEAAGRDALLRLPVQWRRIYYLGRLDKR